MLSSMSKALFQTIFFPAFYLFTSKETIKGRYKVQEEEEEEEEEEDICSCSCLKKEYVQSSNLSNKNIHLYHQT